MKATPETPEADAAIMLESYEIRQLPCEVVPADFARKLERERDALAKDLAEERHAWEKEREDWQADYAAAQIEIQNLRQALSGRTVSCSQCNEAAKQIEDIREAINEAESILSDLCSNYPIERGHVDGSCLKREDVKEIKLTVAKLQPFLT